MSIYLNIASFWEVREDSFKLVPIHWFQNGYGKCLSYTGKYPTGFSYKIGNNGYRHNV